MQAAQTDIETGLTGAEAAARAAAGLANCPPAAPVKTAPRIIAENLFTFFNLVFAVLAAALFAVGSYAHMGFLFVAAANTVIGIAQQLRARQAINKLTLVAARPVRCLRDGAWSALPAAALVQGDIVEFAAGDQICADAVLRAGVAWANEALVTGEEDAVPKRPGDALRSGSFVCAGRCTAQLTDVGSASYASRLTVAARSDVRFARSEMMAALDRLIRWIGLLLLPLGAALLIKQYFWLGMPLREAVEATVAALIGMIPEGLYLLTSIALAVSVLRLARRRVLTRDLGCIETLARVDVLCVDKTGTITAPGMDAEDPVLLDPGAWPAKRVAALLAALYGSEAPENDTAAALAARFAAPAPAGEGWRLLGRIPFDSARKWSAATFQEQGSFVVGAPDILCGAALDGKVRPLLAAGRRVVLLAACTVPPDPGQRPPVGALHPIALLPLRSRLRPGAAEIFRWFAAQGVTVKVISGDDARAAALVARQAGIGNADRWVDAAALHSEEELTAAAEDAAVFGRVTPEQKRRLVCALQRQGHTVAMTGDGVNDVLALTDADCGIAMAGGAQAASQAAQLVLLDADFAALPAIVAEGRRVINNIQRSAALFLIKNIFSFLLSVVTLAAPLAYPLDPLQLSLAGAVTIGIPAFVLALEPSHARVRGRFMTNVLRAALPGGIADFLLLLAVQVAALPLGMTRGEVNTVCTAVLLTVGLSVLWGLCRPFTPRHKALWGSMAALGVLTVVALPPLLDLGAVRLPATLVMAAAMAAAPGLLRAAYRLLLRWDFAPGKH